MATPFLRLSVVLDGALRVAVLVDMAASSSATIRLHGPLPALSIAARMLSMEL
jgi:hypothetical protein